MREFPEVTDTKAHFYSLRLNIQDVQTVKEFEQGGFSAGEAGQ